VKRRLRTAAPFIGAFIALAGAVGAGYVAHEASRVDSEIRRSDAAFRVERAPVGLWRVHGPLERVLGVKDDLAFREAANLYDMAGRRAPTPQGRVAVAVSSGSLRAAAQLALAGAEREGLAASARSKAENLDAVIAIQAAFDDPQNGRMLMQRSLAGFRRAIRIDPGNEEAMGNLELVLRLLSTNLTPQSNPFGLSALGQGVAGATPTNSGHGY
jgi:hypothetical protein